MDEGQKRRHIGKGMKPRGNKQVKPQKETKQMSEQSTTEGQGTVAQEPVLEPQEGNETPRNLEAENEPESLQNLESPVAHDEGLEAALNESGDVIDAEFREVDEWPTHCTHGKSMKEPCEKCQAADMGHKGVQPKNLEAPLGEATDTSPNLQPMMDPNAIKAAQSAYGKPTFYKEPDEAWITKDGIKAVLKAHGLGDQPDGSCGFIVKVQEGYVDAVQQWAEADGVPIERWLSDRLYEYISTYGEPAKGR